MLANRLPKDPPGTRVIPPDDGNNGNNGNNGIIIPPTPRPKPKIADLHAAVGGAAAVGQKLTDPDDPGRIEPAVKVFVPIELGVRLLSGPFWVRIAGVAAPMLNGQFLYSEKQELHTSRLSLGGHLAIGATAKELVHLGLAGGINWPGRLTTRVVVAVNLGEKLPLRLEARGGINLVTDRRIEPAFLLGLVVSP